MQYIYSYIHVFLLGTTAEPRTMLGADGLPEVMQNPNNICTRAITSHVPPEGPHMVRGGTREGFAVLDSRRENTVQSQI